MKKGGIITHYDVHNHGALLQLYALIKVLNQFDVEAQALRFDKNYDFMGHNKKNKYEISLKSVVHYLKFLKERGPCSTIYNFRKHYTLNKFRRDNNLIGEYYSEIGNLDLAIIGSDEVFALHTGPTPVFWGHGIPTDNVFAYAGSFGPTTIEDVDRLHCRAFVSSGLELMKGVTVRDQNSFEVVKSLTNLQVPVVVDPVLLYGYSSEIEKLGRPIRDSYLLVYAYDSRMNDPDEVLCIRDYAQRKGLKVVSCGFYHQWCNRNIDVNPINLLGWFKHADEVITDTFHGSIMSIITGANFIVKTRPENHLKLMNLLSEYGLTSRIITEWETLESFDKDFIDYQLVNREVIRRRKESLEHLTRMILTCK